MTLLCCLALASSAVAQQSLAYEQRIARIDSTLGWFHDFRDQLESASGRAYPDLRGLIALDDIERWTLTPERIARIAALTQRARAAAPEQDLAALDEADAMMYAAVARSEEIREYWKVVPRVSGHARWTAFATANGLSPAPDADWSFEEAQLLEALEAGAFKAAARRTRSIDELVDDAIRSAIPDIVKDRSPENIAYVARTSPCPAGDSTRGTAPARLTKPANPDSLYPPDARDRGERGTIVVRARIAATSCATAFAVLVSSGYRELDAAALAVAEASRFQAAATAGKPLPGEIDFKVRFELYND